MTALFGRVAEVVEHGKFAGDPVTNAEKMNAVLNAIHKEPEHKQHYISGLEE